MFERLPGVLAGAVLVTLTACGGGGSGGDGGDAVVPTSSSGEASRAVDESADAPSVAFVTNGVASFWVIAEKGALDGGAATGAVLGAVVE